MKLRAAKGEGALALEELEGHTTGLVAFAGREVLRARRYGVGGLLDRLVGIFGRANVYVELQRHLLRDEEADNDSLIDLAGAYHVPVIATGGVRFATPEDRPLFDVLTCIHHGVTLQTAGRRLTENAERYLRTPAQMAALFRDLPHAIAATRELADRLQYTMADLGYRFPDYPVPPGETQVSFLRRLAQVGRTRAVSSISRSRARAGRARAGPHREARSRRLLPDCLGHRQFLPAARHPGTGPRVGRQQRRLLQPRHHGRRSGRHGPALRALPLRGARRVARHRSRPAERRPARARHPVRVPAVRRARRRDDGQCDHVSRPERRARGGEGAVD